MPIPIEKHFIILTVLLCLGKTISLRKIEIVNIYIPVPKPVINLPSISKPISSYTRMIINPMAITISEMIDINFLPYLYDNP